MYPQPELSRGEARKAAVRRSIAGRRAQCEEAATLAVQPLALLERMVALWRQLAPYAGLAAIALTFRPKQASAPPPTVLRTLLRWSPILFGLLRLFRSTGKRSVAEVP